MSESDRDRVHFVVWLLGKLSKAWGMSPADAYRLLQREDIVNDYIVRFYDPLHSMGELALVEDISLLARSRGACGMKLYHGSSCIVRSPDVAKSRRNLDFGQGFCTTSIRSQAETWAQRKAALEEGGAYINEYEFDEGSLERCA